MRDSLRKGGVILSYRRLAVLVSCLMSLAPTPAMAVETVVADVRDGHCRMVISGELAVFSVRVDGLVPGEKLSFESVSNGERMASEAQATAEGTYYATLFAAVADDRTGTDTVTIRTSRCALTATFAWSTSE